MANDISELRGLLFDTLRDLRNPEKPLDIDRAKTISDVAQTIINTAKVEVDHMRIAGTPGSGFLEAPAERAKALPAGHTATGTKTVTEQRPGVTVTQHKMR